MRRSASATVIAVGLVAACAVSAQRAEAQLFMDWSARSSASPSGCVTPCAPSSGSCTNPCPPDQPPTPKDEETPTPKDEPTPTGPAGAYVAPPQSGTIEGPQQGIGLGGLSITFPELTIGMPQIRCQGINRFARAGHMRLDGAVAPFVAAPTFATAAAPGTRPTPKDADRPPTPKEELTPPQPPTPKDGSCEERLRRLEECMQRQCAIMESCMLQLQQNGSCTQGVPPVPQYPAPPVEMLPEQRRDDPRMPAPLHPQPTPPERAEAVGYYYYVPAGAPQPAAIQPAYYAVPIPTPTGATEFRPLPTP